MTNWLLMATTPQRSNFGFLLQTCVRNSKTTCVPYSHRGGYMDTGLYRDIVYTEYMLEHDLTWEEMMQKTHTDEMLKRVAHMEWQDEQRAAWMGGDMPQVTVPEDCPF